MPELPTPVDPQRLDALIELAISEDLGQRGDLTSQVVCASEDRRGRFSIVFREQGVLAGAALLEHLLGRLAPGVHTQDLPGSDGTLLPAGQVVATLSGPAAAVLRIERILLNFLQRLSGVATLTRHYVEQVAGTGARIYDTRKTVPGWRDLDKYAVRCGGGFNHRHGLHDAILIKDNHLSGIPVGQLVTELGQMLRRASRLDPPPAFVEVEVDSLEQMASVLEVCAERPAKLGIDLLLLDNFSVDDLRAAARLRADKGLDQSVELEASGKVRLETVRDVAETGIDRISIGAITHSAPALDIALEVSSQG